MLQTIRNAWKIEEIRRKILFTLFMILLYRVGNAIPVPYVDVDTLRNYFNSDLSKTVLGLYNVMSGGAFSQATIFALSIQPYINASIIIQLLCIAIPALERMAKDEGEEGKKKINNITRYSTVGIALLQGFAYYMMLRNYSLSNSSNPILAEMGVWQAIVIILTFTAGSALIMWMGEQITEFGIGNGISIILFVSIISRFPSAMRNLIIRLSSDEAYRTQMTGTSDQLMWWQLLLILIGALAMIVLIVAVNNAERRIPVQYSKRVVGRKQYGGQSTHLPMKVNMSGVLPVIFASAIASLPATFGAFAGKNSSNSAFLRVFDTTSLLYALIYFLLIIFFSYFYSTIQFNPIEVANNLKRNGGFIPGYRPGKPTSEFLSKVLNKITLFGAIFLSIVAVTPYLISHWSNAAKVSGISLGGTSIIIVVGVALETVQALENQMLMRHYKGFLE